MQKATKSERQLLREACWLLFARHICEFCGRLLNQRHPNMTFGHRRHPPLLVKLTVHHRDHDRENNADDNLALVHSVCHKHYHAEVNRARHARHVSMSTDS